ncbi:MAG: undecaprenyl-diphosphate phosphatase [Pirellulaceae bacterium]|jgi:undecaprenyl-diphosphatase|nr:undecaprenyl-diphosphate phosphatase [Pirellulaceae bacterium]
MEPLELWQIAVLAVVQGVTEFLPVSSSGHLVIVAAITGVHDEVADLNVVLHVGTLLSIFVFYWTRIWRLVGEDRRLIPLLIVGTIPAVVVGLTIELFFEEYLESPLLAGCMLPVTGLILLWAAASPRGEGTCGELTVSKSLLIGFSQAFAILPGISRSGSTISAGMRLGLSPQSAATFSFLLAIPAIGGAGVLKLVSLLRDASESAPTTSAIYLLAGAALAFVVGLAALSWLIRWLERGRFQWFAWWCIPVGLAVVAWQLVK